MIDFFKNLVEEAKKSPNHEAVKSMSYNTAINMMKLVDPSKNFNEELQKYMEDNNCTCSFVAEGTMAPVYTVKYNGLKLYYVLEMREEHESCSPLYITSNREKAIKWFSLNTDESLCYFIACKEQQWDDVYLKCNLDDSERKNNYFAGLWQYIRSMDFQEFMDKHGTEYINGPEPEIIDLDELHKDDNSYGIKYFD